MVSDADVKIVRANGDATFDDMNNSMAGLSDVSLGDIQRVNDASMADLSMASLGDDSMASVNDSGMRRGVGVKAMNNSGSQFMSGKKT